MRLARGDHLGEPPRGTHGVGEVAAGGVGECGIEGGRDRDGIAVEAEIERGDDRHLDVAEAERGRDRDRRQKVGGVEQADIELVAHVGPRHFADQLDVEPFGGAKALVDGDDQGRGVGEGNEAEAQALVHLNISAAVMIDWAISEIFFFSFMAVLRISA